MGAYFRAKIKALFKRIGDTDEYRLRCQTEEIGCVVYPEERGT